MKIIVEGLLINTDGEDYKQVEINTETGLIENVGRNLGIPDMKLKNMLVFPGFVDLHVHAREDESGKWTHKEDFKTASEAAINGGVVFFGDMPNTPVIPTNDEMYNKKKALTKSSLVPIMVYAGIGPRTEPLDLDIPYKAFMGPSVEGLFFESQAQLEEAIKMYVGKNISFHCEDPEILKANKDANSHEKRRPREAETVAIDFGLFLIEKYNLIGKICHCSTKEGVESIIQAKSEDVNVTCEVAPHHLYDFGDVLIQINPPIRTRDDRIALIESLRMGDLDYLATDHAPHTIEEKRRGISGVPNLDTYGLFTTWLMKEHNFSPQDIARISSFNPGIFVNKFSDGKKFGKIEEGYVGSLTVINMSSPTRISRENLRTKCGWSPFEGELFPGEVAYTIIEGNVYKDGLPVII